MWHPKNFEILWKEDRARLEKKVKKIKGKSSISILKNNCNLVGNSIFKVKIPLDIIKIFKLLEIKEEKILGNFFLGEEDTDLKLSFCRLVTTLGADFLSILKLTVCPISSPQNLNSFYLFHIWFHCSCHILL